MSGQPVEPPSPEALVGKDELDEDDEMELSGGELLGAEPSRGHLPPETVTDQ